MRSLLDHGSMWLEHPKYPWYLVSPEGDVWSLKRSVLLAKQTLRNGYLYVKACGSNHLVHRLVAGIFCDGYQDGLQVNHKNGVKTDNSAENLEWVTAKKNVQHTFDVLGRKAPKGDSHGSTELSDVMAQQMIDLRYSQKLSLNELADMFGISRGHVSDICSGGTRKYLKRPPIKTTRKLNSEDVEMIRALADPKKRNYLEVATRFGISKAMVCYIKNNKTRLNG